MAEPVPDLSELSPAQQESLETYIAVTDSDPISAIPLLQRAEWNVQIAIARFYDGEPTTDPILEAQASLPASSPRQASNLQYEGLFASHHASSRHSASEEAVQRIDTSVNGAAHYEPPLLFSVISFPLGILYRLFASLLSPFRFLIPSFLPRLFARLFAQSNRPVRRALPPAENTRRFIREFGEEYGDHTVPFVETGFNLTMDNAKRDLKFLMVVLLSPSHDDNSAWVRETLLSNALKQVLSSQADELMLWGGSVQDAEAYQVSEVLKCTKFPFVALLCHNASAGASGLTTVMRSAAPGATELTAKLGAAITAHRPQLATTRAQRSERQASRNLRDEQDSAYERSLAQDRERARLRREEEAAQVRAQQEAQRTAERNEKRRHDRSQWQQWRTQTIPNEPDSSEKSAIRVSIRMPSGERVIRRFRPNSDLEELYAFVDCYENLQDAQPEHQAVLEPENYQHAYEFQLVSPMPRKAFPVQTGGTLEESIGRGANLIVEPLNAASDEED